MHLQKHHLYMHATCRFSWQFGFPSKIRFLTFLLFSNMSINIPYSQAMTERQASHAGSWYSASSKTLNKQLDEYFEQSPEEIVPNARILVAPHAGFAYSGNILANAYKSFDNTNIKRVFIIGPSHHKYFKGFVLTTACDVYKTPLGDFEIDVDVINELIETDTKMFRQMSLEIDEDEHSLEMQLPFLYKVTNSLGHDVKLIPIIISSSNEEFETKLSKLLKPYFQDSNNAFIISSDFCHWGSRFQYTSYTPTGELADLVEQPKDLELPIYQSIQALDLEAVKILESGDYRNFKDYLYLTENTICGAKPLSLLLLLLGGKKALQFNGYAQSSKVKSLSGSSVSYASAYGVS